MSYNHLNKNSIDQQRYYTPSFIVTDAVEALNQYLPHHVTSILDMGAGDGRFGETALKHARWTSVLSMDTKPQWSGPPNPRHRKMSQDALTYSLDDNPTNVVVGFNPPYGLRNTLAKSFIQHGYSLHAGHACWLIPQVLVPFVEQYYRVLYVKQYHRLKLFRFAEETHYTPNPQWVALVVGRRRRSPYVRKRALKGGYDRYKFPDTTNLIVRIIGGKVPFPLFVRRGESWYMYNYCAKPFDLLVSEVTKEIRPSSNSYRADTHVVMRQGTTSYVVGGNAFVKLSVDTYAIENLTQKLRVMAEEHVEKLAFRRRENQRVRHLGRVDQYQHMNAIYSDQSAIEQHYTSYQPQTWNPETIVRIMHGTSSFYVCYLLASGNRTYIGITNNLHRRIRQHNQEIKGGAKYTRGRQWRVVCYVGHFSTKSEAMRFEWRFKRSGRGLNGRLRGVGRMLMGKTYGLFLLQGS